MSEKLLIVVSVDYCYHHSHYHPFAYTLGATRQSNKSFTHPSLIYDYDINMFMYAICLNYMKHKRELLKEITRHAVSRER